MEQEWMIVSWGTKHITNNPQPTLALSEGAALLLHFIPFHSAKINQLNLILFQYFLSWPPQFMNLWMNEGVRRGSLRRLSCASHSSSLVALAWLISLWVKGCCGSHCSAKRETSPSKQSNPPNLINSNHSIIIHSYFDSLILPRCVLFAELSCYYNSIHRFESFIYCYNIIYFINKTKTNQSMEQKK